ncbi:Acyl-CoA dehydrogenase [Frankia canadensis]|uniref:Acyl-CoA dehydrogenase n=1 Tax=Frankia canadensis TaxID=1836972 RepID=A0A2I2KLN2_9ACTN|nr:acyl-CoA dehydrogenase family protein [Frankia canadensis]SNQ46574.1 Acyl-CoA dehydrogenase [Frankia canadensis]SOU53864.1 Acyl-CoA dehydrogenase [Frankia canadensis]
MSDDAAAERRELRDTARRFLAERSSEQDVRRLMDGPGHDPALWELMGRDLGWQGLAIPDAHGGAGYGWDELVIVFEEMGRALLGAPFLATVALAAGALLESGDVEAQARYLPDLAAGRVVATLAAAGDDGLPDLEAVGVRATRAAQDGWRLTGRVPFVLDGQHAALVLLPARTPDGVTLFAVDVPGAGVEVTALETLDLTRGLAVVRVDDTPARQVGRSGDGARIVGRALEFGSVALAAEQTGGAARCLDMAVGYARTREQFGRPIGSFQAVKHICADIFVAVEAARSALFEATRQANRHVAGAAAELSAAAHLAQAICSESFVHAATANIQVHGGIGFTWEHPAHLYFRRARSSEILLGTPAHHRREYARLLGLAA